MATLNELLRDKLNIEDMLIESGGELTPEIIEQMDFNAKNIRDKIDSYHNIVVKMEYGTSEIDAEIKRLQALKSAKKNAVKSLKERLIYLMDEAELQSIDGNLCKAYIKNNAPSLVIDDVVSFTATYTDAVTRLSESFPNYIKVSVDVDRAALKAALKEDEVNGASLSVSRSVIFK